MWEKKKNDSNGEGQCVRGGYKISVKGVELHVYAPKICQLGTHEHS